jgi:hypothetical protein
MYGLKLSGERCPDGVDLVVLSIGRGGGPSKFSYRTARRVPLQIEIENLRNPVAVDYINAHTDAERARFFSRYGMPGGGEEIERKRVLQEQGALNTLLRVVGGDKPAAAIEAITSALKLPEDRLLPAFDLARGGIPRMLLEVQCLSALMHMEAALVAAHGARYRTCLYCKSVYLIGPETERRSDARYCSDRCRVAATRMRNAQVN